MTQAQKYVYCKKSTIFALKSWNLDCMTSSWVGNFTFMHTAHLTWTKLWIFILNMILGLGQIFRHSLWYIFVSFIWSLIWLHQSEITPGGAVCTLTVGGAPCLKLVLITRYSGVQLRCDTYLQGCSDVIFPGQPILKKYPPAPTHLQLSMRLLKCPKGMKAFEKKHI